MVAQPAPLVAPEGASADASESSFYLLKRAYHELMGAFERRTGFSQARLQILILLRKEPELSQSALQQRLDVDGAAITRQVKQLEEEGLVQRRPDPRDNRFTLVALTDSGRALMERLLEERRRFEAELLEGLEPDEIAVMQRCLRRIRENARAAGAAPGREG